MSKKSSITNAQKESLVEFMENHQDLRRGKFSTTFTTAIAKKLWEECRDILNSIPGPNKEWHEWRKTWQDLKAKTKKKKTLINHDNSGTGGGSPKAEPLVDLEERIIGIIGKVPISGDPLIQESIVEFHFDKPDRTPEVICDGNDTASISNIDLIQPLPTLAKQDENSHISNDTQPTKRKLLESSRYKHTTKSTKQVRLDNAAEASMRLSDVSFNRNVIVENYYKAKIELLKRQTELKERSVIARENIARALTVLAGLEDGPNNDNSD